MSWRDTYEQVFGGKHLAAARKLRAAWRKEARAEAEGLTESSLATRIGKLVTGGDRTGWWAKRSVARRIFAELLGLDLDAVFGETPSHAGALSFAEFPRLPALERDEEPCSLSGDGWLLQRALNELRRPLARHAWIKAPAGAGKSLAVKHLQERHASDFLAATVPSLSFAAAHAHTNLTLVVEIESADGRDEAGVLEPLSRRAKPTIVLAPFDLPLGDTVWALGTGSSTSGRGWVAANATPTGNWRSSLLDWIDERLERSETDSKLVKTHVLAWLERHDRLGVVVRTPGDLLALCADFDAHGPGDESLARRAERWVTQVGISMVPAESPLTWRRHAAAKTYTSLVTGHLRDTSRAFGAGDANAFEDLVPSGLRGVAQAERPGASLAIGYLRDAGLIRGTPNGLLPYPPWVVQGLANSSLARDFESSAPERWGALAADVSRQEIVDRALDANSDNALKALIRTLANREASKTLADIGALESALAALGRRVEHIAAPLEARDVDAIHALMQKQLAVVDRTTERPDAARHPFTRRDEDEWFATAWALSLYTPPPQGFARADLAWELPGWFPRLDLATVPRRGLPSSTVMPWGATAEVQRVAALSRLVIGRMKPGPLPAEIPRLLLPALFLAADDWTLAPTHLDAMNGSWEESYLAAEGNMLEPKRRSVVAARIWRLIASPGDAESTASVAWRIGMLRQRYGGLAEFVLANLGAADLSETARVYSIHRHVASTRHQPDANPRELLALPRSGRQAAVRGWLEGSAARDSDWDEARDLVPLLDAQDIDLALDLARASDGKIAAEFTDFVWRTAPRRARAEAANAIENDLPSAEGWLYRAPREEMPLLANLIESRTPSPSWVSRWAERRVLEAGTAAEQLFRLAAR